MSVHTSPPSLPSATDNIAGASRGSAGSSAESEAKEAVRAALEAERNEKKENYRIFGTKFMDYACAECSVRYGYRIAACFLLAGMFR